MSTVAEGVETREQPAFLERAGCNESRGYVHRRPIPAPELELLLPQRADLGVEASTRDELGFLRGEARLAERRRGSPRARRIPSQAAAVN